jgi:hypothetical protein
MSHVIAKRSFLAVLTFIAFFVPLVLTDEVSLLTNWLYIFMSWGLIILLSALLPFKLPSNKKNTAETTLDLTSKE